MRILKKEFNEYSDAARKEALFKQIMTQHKKAEEYRSVYREYSALLPQSKRLFEQSKADLELEAHHSLVPCTRLGRSILER